MVNVLPRIKEGEGWERRNGKDREEKKEKKRGTTALGFFMIFHALRLLDRWSLSKIHLETLHEVKVRTYLWNDPAQNRHFT